MTEIRPGGTGRRRRTSMARAAASGLRGRIGSGGCGSLGRQSWSVGSDRKTPPQRLTRQPGAPGVAGPVPGRHACCRAVRSGREQYRHAPSARRVRSGRSALRRLRRSAEGDSRDRGPEPHGGARSGPGGSASKSPGAGRAGLAREGTLAEHAGEEALPRRARVQCARRQPEPRPGRSQDAAGRSREATLAGAPLSSRLVARRGLGATDRARRPRAAA